MKKIVWLGEIQLKNVNPVMWHVAHIPGHGCSSIDSHLSMPKVNLSRKY